MEQILKQELKLIDSSIKSYARNYMGILQTLSELRVQQLHGTDRWDLRDFIPSLIEDHQKFVNDMAIDLALGINR